MRNSGAGRKRLTINVFTMATILIVDDLPADRDFLAALLRDPRVLAASNGREGLAAVDAGPVDLVITDVVMPVMDGSELVRQLRLHRASKRLSVLFYTAPYSEREARAVARSSGLSWILALVV